MASTNRPGVTVEQVAPDTVSTIPASSLPAVVLAPCFQIIEILKADGSLNADARIDPKYTQSSISLSQLELPDPRENIEEIDVDEGELALSLYYGGRVRSIPRGSGGAYGSAHLTSYNKATQAVIRSSEVGPFSFSSSGEALTFALDVVNPLNVSDDVTVTLTDSMTATEVVDAINAAYGDTVAYVVTVDSDEYVELRSAIYGALSSVTIRPGGSALFALFGSGFDTSVEYRVEGAGWRGKDDNDGDLLTPWVEFYRGSYQEDGESITDFPGSSTTPTADAVWAMMLELDGATYRYGRAAEVTFTGSSATIPLVAATATRPGDIVVFDGVQPGGAEITRVESSRFRMGVLSATKSTVADDGTYTNRVYDTYEVSTPASQLALAPKYAYFRAQGLAFGKYVEGDPAVLTGGVAGLAARSAMISSDSEITFPINPAGLTLVYTLVVDGADAEEQTYTFSGGPYGNATALAAAIEMDGITVTAKGDRLVFASEATGSGTTLTFSSDGTANTVIGIDADPTVSDSGKDVEIATQAEVTGEIVVLPIRQLAGLMLTLTVVDSKGTHTVTGEFSGNPSTPANMLAAISTALGGDGTSTIAHNGIEIATLSYESVSGGMKLTVTTTEGGADVSVGLVASSEEDGFRWLGFYDSAGDAPAIVEADAEIADYAALDGVVYNFSVVDADGTHAFTPTGPVGLASATTEAAVAAIFNNMDAATLASTKYRVQWYVTTDGRLALRTLTGGSAVELRIASGETEFPLLGVDTTSAINNTGSSDSNTDADGVDGLLGTTVGFYFDDCPTIYEVVCANNSLEDLVYEVNTLVGASADVATIDDNRHFVLTSPLVGAASRVLWSSAHEDAATALGVSLSEASGSGRPLPDFYVAGDGTLEIGAMIMREGSQGTPLSRTVQAPIYVGYKALRLDVTASGTNPGLLYFDTMADLEDALSPLTTENPLGLAAMLALNAAGTTGINCLGIDEAPTTAPEGTIDAYARALDLLEAQNVYAIAPMTGDAYINGLVAAHVLDMSDPANRRESVVSVWTAPPERATPTSVVSGSGGTVASDNTITLDESPSAVLSDLGIANGAVAYSEELYLQVVIAEAGATELRRYSVSNVNNTALTLRTTFSSTQNTDGFYTTKTLEGPLEEVAYALYQRGDALLKTGTTRKDYAAIAATGAEEATTYRSRRVRYSYLGDAEVSIDGVVTRVPGYYEGAVWAGMVSGLSPSQSLTRYPLIGIGKVYDTDDSLKPSYLDILMDGGRDVLVNVGGHVESYLQTTTDPSKVYTKQMSITRQLDWFARYLRSALTPYTGIKNISTSLMTEVSTVIQACSQYAVDNKILASVGSPAVTLDPTRTNGLLVELDVSPATPCDVIRIKLYS